MLPRPVFKPFSAIKTVKIEEETATNLALHVCKILLKYSIMNQRKKVQQFEYQYLHLIGRKVTNQRLTVTQLIRRTHDTKVNVVHVDKLLPEGSKSPKCNS